MTHIQELNAYFKGKVCTVFTNQINRSFNEEESIKYFVGIVDYIKDLGIMMTHPETGCKNFYFLNNVSAIIEEQFVEAPPETPQEEKVNNSPYVDIDSLTELSKLST